MGRATTWESALGRPLTALLGAGDATLPLAVLTGPDELTGPLADYCARVMERTGTRPQRTGYHGRSGDHFTVSPMLQVAGIIAEHGRGLVVCASEHGHVAAVYLRALNTVDSGGTD